MKTKIQTKRPRQAYWLALTALALSFGNESFAKDILVVNHTEKKIDVIISQQRNIQIERTSAMESAKSHTRTDEGHGAVKVSVPKKAAVELSGGGSTTKSNSESNKASESNKWSWDEFIKDGHQVIKPGETSIGVSVKDGQDYFLSVKYHGEGENGVICLNVALNPKSYDKIKIDDDQLSGEKPGAVKRAPILARRFVSKKMKVGAATFPYLDPDVPGGSIVKLIQRDKQLGGTKDALAVPGGVSVVFLMTRGNPQVAQGGRYYIYNPSNKLYLYADDDEPKWDKSKKSLFLVGRTGTGGLIYDGDIINLSTNDSFLRGVSNKSSELVLEDDKDVTYRRDWLVKIQK